MFTTACYFHVICYSCFIYFIGINCIDVQFVENDRLVPIRLKPIYCVKILRGGGGGKKTVEASPCP